MSDFNVREGLEESQFSDEPNVRRFRDFERIPQESFRSASSLTVEAFHSVYGEPDEPFLLAWFTLSILDGDCTCTLHLLRAFEGERYFQASGLVLESHWQHTNLREVELTQATELASKIIDPRSTGRGDDALKAGFSEKLGTVRSPGDYHGVEWLVPLRSVRIGGQVLRVLNINLAEERDTSGIYKDEKFHLIRGYGVFNWRVTPDCTSLTTSLWTWCKSEEHICPGLTAAYAFRIVGMTGDLSYPTRHRPYYHSHRFTFELGNIDLPVPRTPVIVPRDVIASTFYDPDDEFELDDDEEVEVSDEENESDTGEEEDEDEDENVVEANHIPLLACYVFSILLAFLLFGNLFFPLGNTISPRNSRSDAGHTATREKDSKIKPPDRSCWRDIALWIPAFYYIEEEETNYESMKKNGTQRRTYLDERVTFDANMIEEPRNSVDVLLVFAGLFSVVVRTLVVQTSQSLQTDYAEISANLLFEIINIQRALASDASLDIVSPSPLDPNMLFVATTTRLQEWRVLVIIGLLLSVLMNTALAIFFVGLVIYLGPLQIAWIVDSQPVSISEWKDLQAMESEAVQSISGYLSLTVLHWLFSMTSNPTVQSIAMQAVAGLDLSLKSNAERLSATPDSHVVRKFLRYKQCLQFSDHIRRYLGSRPNSSGYYVAP
ncbi:hypothetical protein F5146DRAFT_1116373 [Armillaria mellea]|nr:hypothetical protein F5146DRAFT_1116373 [Armillaria mellea]